MGVFTKVEGEERDKGAVWPDGYSEDRAGELPHCREAVNEMDKVMSSCCRTITRRRRDGMDLRTRGQRGLPKRGPWGRGRRRRIFDKTLSSDVRRIHGGRFGDARQVWE
jgi:hypothetical protein